MVQSVINGDSECRLQGKQKGKMMKKRILKNIQYQDRWRLQITYRESKRGCFRNPPNRQLNCTTILEDLKE